MRWLLAAAYTTFAALLVQSVKTGPALLRFGAALLLVPPLLFLGLWAYTLVLLYRVRRRWQPQGIRALLVYSHSPKWQEHIERVWLPRLGPTVRTLDWSQRKSRPASLEASLFRRYGGAQDFNPLVVVFRGLGEPLVFRFYRPSLETARGNPGLLHALELRFFEAVGGDDPLTGGP